MLSREIVLASLARKKSFNMVPGEIGLASLDGFGMRCLSLIMYWCIELTFVGTYV
jgi:hypothetical protein